MAILRRKNSEADDPGRAHPGKTEPNEAVDEVAQPDDAADPRAGGPWDVSERETEDDPSYVDLGALRVRGRPGMEVRLQSDADDDRIAAALIVTEDSALELRAFAGPKSPGQWEVVRADLVEEVGRLDGAHEEADGPFGTELRIRIPVTLDDGQEGFQPSRIVGIDGPRWMLRATFLGRSALEPSDDDVLIDTLRDVVVVRGAEAMLPREALLLTAPETAIVPGAEPDADSGTGAE